MPILGPNCYGAINYLDGALLWFDQHGGRRCERGVAILTQSGNIGLNLTMQRRGLPIGHLLTLGNQAKVGLSDCIAALVDDPRVTAIGLHIEAIDDVAAFDAAARKALAARKPVVAVKAGRSDAGAALALSHTASLAGADAAMDALLRRVGVARVASLPILLETLKLLHTVGPLPGRDLVTLSCSGGEAALIADAGAGRRVRFRPFAPGAGRGGARHAQRPRHHLQPARLPHLHLGPARAPARHLHRGHGLRLGPRLPRPRPAARGQLQRRRLAGLARTPGRRRATRPGAGQRCWRPCPNACPSPWPQRLIAAGIVPLLGIDEALAACEAAADIGAAQAAAAARAAAAGTHAARARPSRWTSGGASSSWPAFGLPHPGGRLVATPAEAVARPPVLGYPVVVKAVGAALAHKSELGAVALDLRDAGAVEAAATRMAGLGEAILVEPMIADGVAELILGVDPRPAGRPVPGDRLGRRPGRAAWPTGALLLLPTTAAEVRAAVLGLKGAPLLHGFRGRPAGDLDAVVAAAWPWPGSPPTHADRLVELDVNPLIVRPAGKGAVAADVLIRLIAEDASVMSEAVRDHAADGILEVVLDRPKANAIDSATSRALGQAFAGFRDDPELRVAIVTGGGEKFFSAGWDLKAAAEGCERPDSDYGVGGFGGLQELPDLNKPVIAALNGMAVGGGFELALSCDLILAAEHVRFALPEIAAGTLADAATIKLPRRIPHHVAMDLLLTGRWMDAAEAKHWGLVNEILPADRLLPRAREIARLLADGPPLVFAAIKETLRRTEGLPFQSAMDLVTRKQLPTVRRLYESEDQLEGARAFAEKRKPVWRGR